MIDFHGKVALITGGSRGIGAAAAILFARGGADVAITYRNNSASAKQVAAGVRGEGKKCITIRADVGKEHDARKVVRAVLKEFGKIDVLVNNAGIWTYGEMGSMRPDVWRETMRINLDGTYFMTNAVVPHMKRRKEGKIINLSSTAGQRGEAFHSHYAATKGAIISLTKSLSTELGQHNINVNAVAPGWVDTDMSAGVLRNPRLIKGVVKGIPIGRIPTAEDIAGPIIFLASELARHITGEILNVNGGSVLAG